MIDIFNGKLQLGLPRHEQKKKTKTLTINLIHLPAGSRPKIETDKLYIHMDKQESNKESDDNEKSTRNEKPFTSI